MNQRTNLLLRGVPRGRIAIARRRPVDRARGSRAFPVPIAGPRSRVARSEETAPRRPALNSLFSIATGTEAGRRISPTATAWPRADECESLGTRSSTRALRRARRGDVVSRDVEGGDAPRRGRVRGGVVVVDERRDARRGGTRGRERGLDRERRLRHRKNRQQRFRSANARGTGVRAIIRVVVVRARGAARGRRHREAARRDARGEKKTRPTGSPPFTHAASLATTKRATTTTSTSTSSSPLAASASFDVEEPETLADEDTARVDQRATQVRACFVGANIDIGAIEKEMPTHKKEKLADCVVITLQPPLPPGLAAAMEAAGGGVTKRATAALERKLRKRRRRRRRVR